MNQNEAQNLLRMCSYLVSYLALALLDGLLYTGIASQLIRSFLLFIYIFKNKKMFPLLLALL